MFVWRATVGKVLQRCLLLFRSFFYIESYFISFKWRSSFSTSSLNTHPSPEPHNIGFYFSIGVNSFFLLHGFFLGGVELSFPACKTKGNLIRKIKSTFLAILIMTIKSNEPHLNNSSQEQNICLFRCFASWRENISLAPKLTEWSHLCAASCHPLPARCVPSRTCGEQGQPIPEPGARQCQVALDLRGLKWHKYKTLTMFSLFAYICVAL